jgi:hypothetical protein
MDREFPMRRWVVAAVAIVAAIAIGSTAYQAGVSHGIAMQAAAAPGAADGAQAVQPPPYPYYPYRYYGPWRFGLFGFFGPLLTIFLFVFLLRTLFWGFGGSRWRHRYWQYDPELGASRFDEWHRRAHERMRDGGAAPPANA